MVQDLYIRVSNVSEEHEPGKPVLAAGEGTAWRIAYVSLDPGDTLYVDTGRLPAGTAVRGMATYANECDYWIGDEQEQNV